jgi:hypothetical protein
MTIKVIFCIVGGHRWAGAADIDETFPVLRCARCGRNRKLAPGTSDPEGWIERGGRRARADQFMDGRIQRKP